MPLPPVIFRRMAKRWGSCTKDGRLIINTKLTKASVYCIDYVLTHELCHLKHPNHSKGFFNLLAQRMPDWERRKERLERALM